MIYGFLLGGLLLALTIVGIFAAIKAYDSGRGGASALYGVLAAVFLLCFFVFPFSFHQVNTGEVAVVKHLGEVKEVRRPGVHYDLWLTNSYQFYDTKVQNIDIVAAAYSSDAQTMDIQMTLQYQISADHVMDIAKQYGSLEILQNRIQSVAVEKTKSVLSSYKAMDIIANRATISSAVEEAIKSAIGAEYFCNVNTVVLTNIDFSDAFEKAVEDKMIAEQNKLKEQYNNDAKVAAAEADAAARVAEANAQAEVTRTLADAEKYANDILMTSLTDEILVQMWLEKWNGVLPEVMAGADSGDLMIGIGD